MQRNSKRSIVTALLIAIFAVVGVNAGGPLFMWNAEQRIPYRWDVTNPVPVYTDLGPFEIIPPQYTPIPREVADGIVEFALTQWTNVETSSFQAQRVGDFGMIGLPDITGANAGQVIGFENGGGITVIYDADATIMRDFFGVGSTVLGIASPEWADESTGTITEGWVVINAQRRHVNDQQLLNYAGVFTHEFGHSINLAHSQTNGGIAFYNNARGPAGCTTLPYDANAVTIGDIETMYPFINPQQTGSAQSSVDRTDDKAALSDLYPAPGYPASKGSITGKVLQTNGKDGITGVNIIARNLDEPFSDAVSVMSGDWVRVPTGDDGSYTINGLTPGARYALYIDSIVNGGFPTQQPFFLPAPEEFFNGASESGNGLSDHRCQASEIVAQAGSPVEADVVLNSVKGAPKFTPMAPGTVPQSISSDGRIIAGNVIQGPVFRFTETEGYEVLTEGPSGNGKMSRDGQWFGGDPLSSSGERFAGILKYGEEWDALPIPSPVPPAVVQPCGAGPTSNYGVASGGVAATGSLWVDGNGPASGGTCQVRPYLWTQTGGSTVLPTPANIRSSRPNNISDDGSTVVGWYDSLTGSFRNGAIWKNGQLIELGTAGNPVGEAYNVNPDGSVVVGSDAGSTRETWRWTQEGGIQPLGRLYSFGVAGANALSDDGNVIAGLGGSVTPFPGDVSGRRAFLWTPFLGMVNFEEFLRSQGTFFDGWTLNTALAMSADGTRLVGVGFSPRGQGGWIIDIDKVNICHAPPGRPSNAKTINVPFNGSLSDHLRHGDTIGVCASDYAE